MFRECADIVYCVVFDIAQFIHSFQSSLAATCFRRCLWTVDQTYRCVHSNTTLIFTLLASQLRSISRTSSKTALLYNLAYIVNSEALAFALAWTQFLDGLGLAVTLVQTLSDHCSLLFDNTSASQIRVDFDIANLIFLRFDVVAIVVIWLAAAIMSCSLRILTTISIVFLVACLFTATSTTVVALLHNLAHLKVNYINFPYSFDEVFNGTCWLLIVILCLELLTFTSEE